MSKVRAKQLAAETVLTSDTLGLSPALMAVLSAEQQLVASDILNYDGNMLVIARAGTGKTYTLRKLVTLMVEYKKAKGGNDCRIAFASLNRKIADELIAKVTEDGNADLFRQGDINTFHGHGSAVLRACFGRTIKLEGKNAGQYGEFKFDIIARNITVGGKPLPQFLATFVRKAMSMAMQSGFGCTINGQAIPLNDPARWMALVNHHDLDSAIGDDNEGITFYNYSREELVRMGLQYAAKAITEGRRLMTPNPSEGRNTGIYSFDDMLYMPIALNLAFPRFDFLGVDEAQDTNVLRREMAARMVAWGSDNSGRLTFVGDDKQAINGWTGADNDALAQIERIYSCKRRYLTVTRRCAKAIVRKAQTLVPDFKAHEDNAEGEVIEGLSFAAFMKDYAAGLTIDDAILCRNTKPLVIVAYKLIRAGIGCHIEGKEIGEGLLSLISRWKKVKTLPALQDKLVEYRDREVLKATAENNGQAAEAVSDRVETVLAIIEGMTPGSTLEALQAQIKRMFTNTPDGKRPDTVTLMTAHRSKGLEYKRVFGLGVAELFPSKWATQEWQLEQENNLLYVLYTRAIETLILMGLPEN